jgi:hypothetical protein
LSCNVSAAVNPAMPPPTIAIRDAVAARALAASAAGPPRAIAAPAAPERLRNSPRE